MPFNHLKSLPTNFGDLASLEHFAACVNRITSLPDSFGRLTSLRSLSIGANAMASLPDVFSGLSRLLSLIADQFPPSLPGGYDNVVALPIDADANGFQRPGNVYVFLLGAAR